MTLVYLVRHLPTEYSLSGVYMGRRHDLPILEDSLPEFEALLTESFPKGVGQEALLFSSPSLRCRQTADVLRDTLGLTGDLIITEEFAETNYGGFEGQHPHELKEKYPELYWLWMNTPSKVVFPGGESFQQVQDRSFGELLDLLEEYSERTLFVVTHVDVIKMVVSKALSIPIDSKRYFRIDTGSISCLEVEGDEIRVRYLNRT